MITLIVARDRNGAIGRGNDIPWTVPEDLALFRRETLGGAIVMGRRTWESLPVRPLKDRLNIVISSTMTAAETVVPTPEDAIRLAVRHGHRRIYAIGGAAVYRAFLPLAHRLLITEVALDVADADTFFPDVALQDWEHLGKAVVRESGPRCELHEYLRKTP